MVDPTLQASATEATQPALVVVTETPAVNPDYSADVIALGAGDSILKLGMNVTVVNFSLDPALDGCNAVISGVATNNIPDWWLCTVCTGDRTGEERNISPVCLRTIVKVSAAPPRRSSAMTLFGGMVMGASRW